MALIIFLELENLKMVFIITRNSPISQKLDSKMTCFVNHRGLLEIDDDLNFV